MIWWIRKRWMIWRLTGIAADLMKKEMFQRSYKATGLAEEINESSRLWYKHWIQVRHEDFMHWYSCWIIGEKD